MTSYTTQEVHNVLHCRQRRTEPRPQVTCTENFMKFGHVIYSERELTFTSLYAVARPSSVCRLSSVTFVRPTQAVVIFRNISTALGTLAIL